MRPQRRRRLAGLLYRFRFAKVGLVEETHMKFTFTSIAKRLPAIRTIRQHAAAVKGADHCEIAGKTIEDRYLNLLKRSLTRYGLCREYEHVPVLPGLNNFLSSRGLAFVRVLPSDSAARIDGSVMRPSDAETMIGLKRLDNLQNCIVDVLKSDVPGDLIDHVKTSWSSGGSFLEISNGDLPRSKLWTTVEPNAGEPRWFANRPVHRERSSQTVSLVCSSRLQSRLGDDYSR